MATVPIVEILEQLQKRGVPHRHPVKMHTMTPWERVLYFAENYADINAHFTNDLRRQVFGEEPATFNPALVPRALTPLEKLAGLKQSPFPPPYHAAETVETLSVVEPATPEPVIELTSCQIKAWDKLEKWLASGDPYFVLKGYAGTGKTFMMKKLLGLTQYNFAFTAPTNKATQVLAATLGVSTKTLYSKLGLRMEREEEGMVLTMPDLDKIPYMRAGTILVVDEAGMVNKQLCKFVEEVRKYLKIRVLYVGDPMQLNPVGEKRSPTWKVTEDKSCRALLKTVKRFDNQLLTLSTRIREQIKAKDWTHPIVDDHDDAGGVHVLNYKQFTRKLLQDIKPETFAARKVLAWRNKTVERYNATIRNALGFKEEYCVGDRLLLASPVEVGGQIIATIDEEGSIIQVVSDVVNVGDESAIPVWSITLQLEDRPLKLNVVQEKYEHRLTSLLNRKAAEARNCNNRSERRNKWDEFWLIKNKFHDVRFAYALTTHRAQGSTYTEVFVDQEDVLSNPDKLEAFRCLYVDATRPTTALYTY